VIWERVYSNFARRQEKCPSTSRVKKERRTTQGQNRMYGCSSGKSNSNTVPWGQKLGKSIKQPEEMVNKERRGCVSRGTMGGGDGEKETTNVYIEKRVKDTDPWGQ